MRLSNGIMQGSFPIKTTPIGAGGYVTGGDISPDGLRMAHWTDVFNGYIRDKTDKAWRLFLRPDNMPVGEFDPQPFRDKAQGETGISGMRIAPSNKNIIYALYNAALYKTTDGAVTITKTNMPLICMHSNGGACRRYNRMIDVHPTDANIVLVGSNHKDGLVNSTTQEDGVRYSLDGGNTWTSITLPAVAIVDPGSDISKYLVGFDPGAPTNVYIQIPGYGLCKSSTGLTGSFTLIAGTPTTCSSLVCHTDGNVYMANEVSGGGTFWKLTRSGTLTRSTASPTGTIAFIAVDPTNPNHIVCMGDGGTIVHTIDAGATWVDNAAWYGHLTVPTFNKLLRGPGEIGWLSNNNMASFPSHIFYDPIQTNRLWRFDGVGISYCDNVVMTWANNPMIFNDYSIGNEELIGLTSLSVPGKKEPILTFWDKPLWKLTDQDNYTNEPKYPMAPGEVYNPAFVTMGTSVDYAIDDTNWLAATVGQNGSLNGYTIDYGNNWIKWTNLPNNNPGGALAVSNKGNVVVLPSNNGFGYYTKNGGTTWLPLTFGGVNPVASFANAYYVRRMNISSDKTRPGVFALVYTVISADGQRLDNPLGGLWVSTDSGDTWTHKITGLIKPPGTFTSIDTRQFWACELRYVPGFSSEMLFTGHSDYTGDPLMWLQNDGATVADVRPSVRNVASFGFGKSAPGQTRPAVYFYGEVNGYRGVYVSLDWFATDPILISHFMGNTFCPPSGVNGDMNVFGRAYIAMSGEGFRTINYDYKLHIQGT